MKHEDIMKLCVDLEEEIEKGLGEGSISTSRANNIPRIHDP